MIRTVGIGLLCVSAACAAQCIDIPNPSFEDGLDQPLGWNLTGEQGAWVSEGHDGTRAIAVTGTSAPGNTSAWISAPLAFEPNRAYRLRFFARSDKEGVTGTPVSGPVFCNRDLGAVPQEWAEFTSIFVTPSVLAPDAARLRFGQWERPATVFFDALEITRIDPIYLQRNGFVLGEGEQVAQNKYVFHAPYTGESRNQSRPLAHHRGTFNTLRWTFPGTEEIVYHHDISRRQTGASVDIGVCLYSGGELLVECGTDGQAWQPLGSVHALGTTSFAVPKELFPADTVWIRLSPLPDAQLTAGIVPGAFQVDTYEYRAAFEGTPDNITGATRFLAMNSADPRLNVHLADFGACLPGGDNVLEAEVDNLGGETIAAHPTLAFIPADGMPVESAMDIVLQPGRQTVRLPYVAPNAGTATARFTLGTGIHYAAETQVRIPDLYDASYGWRLPQSSGQIGVWWCRSGWKISQTRPLPAATSDAVEIKLAANESDAAQLVIRPSAEVKSFSACASALQGANGATIPADCVSVLRARYVNVVQPTDAAGIAAPWPDPLPPFNGPITLTAGSNQPLWIRVTAPAATPSGVYSGTLHLQTGADSMDVPLRVTVFGFVLPDRMTCTSAFGFSPARMFAYQKLQTPEEQRAVMEKYWASFAAHHISPYDPAPLDPLVTSWPALEDWMGSGVRDRSEKYDGESALFLEDASTTAAPEHVYAKPLPIPPHAFRLRFMYKTRDPGQAFTVTLSHFDAGGQWMPERNHDLVLHGDGTWQAADHVITAFPEGARTAKLILWPTVWSENGSTTGAVWFDNVSLQDADTGAEQLTGGGFEPVDPATLIPAFDWSPWDAAVSHAMETYHFNGIRVSIQGMGGGTFHERWEPNLLGYGEHTPEYQAAFRNYCQGLQEHLRQKGLLPYAYVYWFDEPEPRDYEFVMNGFRRIKEAAPEIGRMLTEQVEPELAGGPNIWCPLTPAYDMQKGDERRAQGDRFWWYVCCGPHEPYCTLFLDHPAVELRVWLWQTWQRKIEGILVWETNYWNSGPAYPDPEHPQNPYEDTMSWTEGYSTPAGARLPWGNGDGRFIYPPEAAADGRPAAPVLDGPVDSIRWEMLRDGIEDYEYLAILRRLLNEHGTELPAATLETDQTLLDVPADISSSITRFTRSPEPIENRREAIARAIEGIMAGSHTAKP